MKDHKIIEEISVLYVRMVCILMKGVDKDCKFIFIFVDKECGKLTVDEEGVTIVFILHQLDHL